MQPAKCFFRIKEQWYALLNWQTRTHTHDAVVFRALSAREVELFQALSQQGIDEASIFARLFPPPTLQQPTRTVRLPVTLLTKTQLAHVITNKLGRPLPSLTRMRKADLMQLLECL